MDGNRTHPTEPDSRVIHQCASQHKSNSLPVIGGDSPFNHCSGARDHVVTKQALADGVIPVRGSVPNPDRVLSVGGGERGEQSSVLIGHLISSLVMRMDTVTAGRLVKHPMLLLYPSV